MRSENEDLAHRGRGCFRLPLMKPNAGGAVAASITASKRSRINS
jgi:hypothetical protein